MENECDHFRVFKTWEWTAENVLYVLYKYFPFLFYTGVLISHLLTFLSHDYDTNIWWTLISNVKFRKSRAGKEWFWYEMENMLEHWI